jgi:two-component system, NtrC family, response regulator HydG
MLGRSLAMRRVLTLIDQIAPTDASAIITGESGTGKELVAKTIHALSKRSQGPYIAVNCAAIPETLMESELFGHERGAFTGAVARRDGRFQQADSGTLFLDEIGEISPAIQVKLLRFLQEREFERVGGNETITVDVRVIAATNRNLPRMVEEGKFREDLFYRLNVISLEMPALRARPSDVSLLASHFLRKYAGENGKELRGFSAEALEHLTAYNWPGNVRELENVVERAVVLAQSAEVTLADLPPQLAAVKAGEGLQIPGATMDEIERYAITKTLESTGGSTSRAAEILNVSVRKIQYKLHEYESAPKSARPSLRQDEPEKTPTKVSEKTPS